MSDYISVENQQRFRYLLSTSVSTEGTKQQLHLCIYCLSQEKHVENEASKLGMLTVERGDFIWPDPRGKSLIGIVKMEDFSCKKQLETEKLFNTKYPPQLTYNLPSTTSSTKIIGHVEIFDFDQNKQLVFLKDVKFPYCPMETRLAEEHEEENQPRKEVKVPVPEVV